MVNEDINILLIEDEKVWTHIITHDLKQLGYTLSAVAENFEDAVYCLNNSTYDVILLDINLNDKQNGLELGQMISKLYKKPFIYLTASPDAEAAQKAIATNPSAYLLKPVNSTSLFVAIQNAILQFNSNTPITSTTQSTTEHNFFFVKQGDKYKRINWSDVVYMRSDKNYTLLYSAADSTEYAIRSTLTRTLKLTVPQRLQGGFAQLNRSEAVQLSYIQELKNNMVVTKYGTFTVTEGYFVELRNMMHVVA